MKHDQYWSKPKKAKAKPLATAAWWYADEHGIEIHVDPDDTGHITIRLTRSALMRYVEYMKCKNMKPAYEGWDGERTSSLLTIKS